MSHEPGGVGPAPAETSAAAADAGKQRRWIVCKRCGQRYPPAQTFCEACNAFLDVAYDGEWVDGVEPDHEPVGPRCTRCGTVNDPTRDFCRRCGEDLAPPTPPLVMPVVSADLVVRLPAPTTRRPMPIALLGAAALILVVAGAGGYILVSGAVPSPTASATAQASSSNSEGAVEPSDSAAPTPTSTVPPSGQPVTSGWTEVGSLKTGLWAPGVAVLEDGSVLLAGGSSSARSDGAVASARLLTLQGTSLTFDRIPDLREARAYAVTVPLADGSVLVAGGLRDGRPLRSAERYDPTTGTWLSAGTMTVARAHATATLLLDGRVLVAGGGTDSSGDATATAELFDPGMGTWTRTGSMGTPRTLHEAARTQDGRVLAAGGADNFVDGDATASTETFDPATGTWSPGPAMSAPRSAFASTTLNDGRLLILGGWSRKGQKAKSLTSTEVLEAVTDAWHLTGRLHDGRGQPSVVTLADGRVLVAGGRGPTASGERLDSAEIYDPSTGTWRMASPMPYGASWPVLLELIDGRVLAFGGLGRDGSPVANVVVFAPPAP